MRIKKLLHKGTFEEMMPLVNDATLPNTNKKVHVDLEISTCTNALHKKGCYLAFKDAKGTKLYTIKISNKEAYKLKKSTVVYKHWRIK